MQIQGPTYLHGSQAISAPHATRADARPGAPATRAASDELQLSTTGQFVDQASELPAIRHDRVAALKAAISSGAYETSDKMGVALDRLLDEIA